MVLNERNVLKFVFAGPRELSRTSLFPFGCSQSLEVELRTMQAHSLQSEGYLVHLDERLSSFSSSTGRNLTGLIAEVARTSTWLHDQNELLMLDNLSLVWRP